MVMNGGWVVAICLFDSSNNNNNNNNIIIMYEYEYD